MIQRPEHTKHSAEASTQWLLEGRNLTAGYGDLAAVRDVSITLGRGEIVALLGPNGAGKTTTLMTLAGILPKLGGEVLWLGEPARGPLHRRARAGLALVPEGRSVLMGMSVRDNLLLGRGGVDRAIELFPPLKPLLKRQAGLLSGGEQQMLTLSRCLASRPAAMLIDELSLGLAPIIVDRLSAALRQAVDEDGIGVLLVEQQARRALNTADRWYLMRQGSIVSSGDSQSAKHDFETAYLFGATDAPSPQAPEVAFPAPETQG
jgi:branched-chain amino acid transport system ATP-binding protein